MNRRDQDAGTRNDPLTRESGVASSRHQPLRRPGNTEETADALQQASATDRGADVDDHLRDRDSKGVAGGYDDSIDREGAH
ncbi:MAG TPA: hypothetical protein VM576_01960 [Xanthomonadaceae bacterium]|jgi:hypothetical protein|nr:hypothetical protein [Xanthomonadaceae bacterium]